MDDMISRISSILDDPEQAAKIKQIAASMMGESSEKSEPIEVKTESEDIPTVAEATSAPVSRSYEKLFSSMNCSKNVTLLNAIRPYMRSSRAEKIGSAIKAMEMIELLSKLK